MKKLLMAIAALSASVGLYAACVGPYCYDDVGPTVQGQLGLPTQSFTVATSTPTRKGVIIFDSNYVMYVSTCTVNTTCWVQPKSQ